MVKSEVKLLPVFLVVIGIGLILRFALAFNLGSVDGDTAFFGLMAKHIMELKEFPAYMVLLHYAGTIASYTGAVFFKFFGVSSTVYNLVGAIFSSLWVILIFIMSKELLGRFGVFAALLSAVLPFYGFLYYLALTSQFGESVFFITLTLFVLIKWAKGGYANDTGVPALLGLCCGVTLWTTPGAVPALLTIATVALSRFRKRPFFKVALLLLAGFLIGYAPAIAHNINYPFASFYMMAGRIFDVDRSILSAADPAGMIFQKTILKILAIPGSFFKMPGLVASMIGIPAAALFIVSAFFVMKDHGFKRGPDNDIWRMLLLYICWSVVFQIALVQAPRYRYVAPLCAVFPVFIGYLVSRFRPRLRVLGVVLLSIVILYNGRTIACSFPAKNTNIYAALAEHLTAKGLRYGFSDYYTGYITQFETKEKIIISPTLFHPTFCDRWPEQTKLVRSAPEVFYLINKRENSGMALTLEEKCRQKRVSYRKEDVEGFGVYYDFSSKIYPEELSARKF
jgi:hypothetical protein